MAWANDTEYANVFAPQVECWAEPGDLVLGISGSGNSPNVLNGVQAAKRKGARTFGIVGFGGGMLAQMAEHSIVVHSDNMQLVEDLHSIILHAAFTELRERLKEQIGG
jgi:D-sedoheptulose 7-phosphate isomerase